MDEDSFIELVPVYCPECDEEYQIYEGDETCPICLCEVDVLL